MNIRPIARISQSRPVREGAGVHLNRAIGLRGADPLTDPFLLLDDFRSADPADYMAGFPSHPHRGMETITYVLAGTVAHGDSLGHKGETGPGGVQWMTAGSGIIHEEMPRGDADGRMEGFQLWANLPRAQKMAPPRYQEFPAARIPVVETGDGSRVKLICGRFGAATGPVQGVSGAPLYFDVTVAAGAVLDFDVPADHHAFAYVIGGQGRFGDPAAAAAPGPDGESVLRNRDLVVFGAGDTVRARGDAGGELRFLLIAGKPIKEPVAWYGPVVMNSEAEIRAAFEQLDAGTFLDAH